MSALGDFFNAPLAVLRLKRENEQLRAELDTLRAQNHSMKQGMRRCVTCEYRIEYKQERNSARVDRTLATDRHTP